MKNQEISDNTIAYLVGISTLLALGFLFVFLNNKPPANPALNVSFAKLEPMSMQGKDFTMRTSLALQSSPEDGANIQKQRKALANFLQLTLENSDPALLSSPDVQKFQKLEQALTVALKQKFPDVKVQQVWITDFVTAAD